VGTLFDEMPCEWAEVAPRKVIVATAERAWVHTLRLFPDPFARHMERPGAAATTRLMLDAAMVTAEREVGGLPPPRLTRARYAWNLVAYYVTAHAAPPALLGTAERFAAAGRPDLESLARHMAKEETGHDRLALGDLEAMGYEAAALVEAECPRKAQVMVEALARISEGAEPVLIFGYCYALERAALRIGRDTIAALELLLPEGRRATRCIRVHSAVGAEARHVEHLVRSIARLPAADRIRVTRGVYETTRNLARSPHEWQLSEGDVERRLIPFRSTAINQEVLL
jgi:hypothetical protein